MDENQVQQVLEEQELILAPFELILLDEARIGDGGF